MSATAGLEAEIAELEATMPPEAAEPESAAPVEPAPVEPEPEAEPSEEEAAPANMARALNERRRELKELKQELAERDRQQAILADRLDRMEQARQQAPKQPEPAEELPKHIKLGKPTVTFDDDPGEYLKQRDEITDSRDNLVLGHIKNEQKRAEEQQQHAELIGAIREQEARFAQVQPDYLQAVEYARERRVAQLVGSGLYTQMQALRITTGDELAIAQRALQMRRNPAEAAYALAKQFGYTAPNDSAPPQPAATPAPAPAKPNLATMAAGQREAATLSAASGSGAGRMTADSLLKMSESEFEKRLAKMSRDEQKAMFGA